MSAASLAAGSATFTPIENGNGNGNGRGRRVANGLLRRSASQSTTTTTTVAPGATTSAVTGSSTAAGRGRTTGRTINQLTGTPVRGPVPQEFIPAAALPPTRIPRSPWTDEPMVMAGGPWKGPSLKAASGLKVPIALSVLVALFLVLQSLIDRRDPKVAAAPRRGDDDTVGFG